MPCITDLTPDQLQTHLHRFNFTLLPPDESGDHDQDLYWTPSIPGYTHDDTTGTDDQTPKEELGITLRQQTHPGSIRLLCQTCLNTATVNLPGTLAPPATNPDPNAPALYTQTPNDDLVKLLLRTPFPAAKGSVFNHTSLNWDTITINDCCSPGHTLTLHLMADGSHEPRCTECGPNRAAQAFFDTFRIGLLMATQTDLEIIQPEDRRPVPPTAEQAETPPQATRAHSPDMNRTITNLAVVLDTLAISQANDTPGQAPGRTTSHLPGTSHRRQPALPLPLHQGRTPLP